MKSLLLGVVALAPLLLAGVGTPPQPPSPWEPLHHIPVLERGRVQPMDTLVRETVAYVTGKESFKSARLSDSDPAALVFNCLAAPEIWKTVPLIEIQDFGLKAELHLARETTHVSLEEAQRNGPLQDLVASAREKRTRKADVPLTRLEKKADELQGRANALAALIDGRFPAMFPVPDAGPHAWAAPADLAQLPADIQGPYPELMAAIRSGDPVRTGASALAFSEHRQRQYAAFLAAAPAGDWTPFPTLEREVLYNRLKLYTKAWLFYLLAFALFLATLTVQARGLLWTAVAVLGTGFLCHLSGFILRFSVLGRIPLSNLYEALTFVGLGIVLWGLILECVYKARWFGLVASLLGFVALVMAAQIPFLDPRMGTLVPALRSYWMNYHVSSMLLGYAGGFVAAGLGHLYLLRYVFGKSDPEQSRRFDVYMYRAIQIAALFIGVGLMLGAVWAAESWGRYWGWDPKETWALITFFGYVVTLHGRILGILGGLGTAVMSVLGLWLLLMTFYGVNLIGKGLHSYGFFEGGWIPFWIFTALEGLLVGAVWMKHTRSRDGVPEKTI